MWTWVWIGSNLREREICVWIGLCDRFWAGANFFKISVKHMSVKSLALVFLSRLDTLVRGLNSCLKCEYRKYNDDWKMNLIRTWIRVWEFLCLCVGIIFQNDWFGSWKSAKIQRRNLLSWCKIQLECKYQFRWPVRWLKPRIEEFWYIKLYVCFFLNVWVRVEYSIIQRILATTWTLA